VVSVGFTLYSSDFDYMNSYKIFNPLFVSLSYISYGIFFALGMALLSWLISKTPFFSNDYEFNNLFYTIFCHSLRFYAAVGLFLGTLAIHGTGLVITKGINFNTAFDHWFFTIAIIVTVIWFPIRLYVNPLFKFLNPIRLNYIGYFLILFAVFVITTISQVLPLPFTDTMLVKKEVCTFFKSGVLYKSAPINKRIEMEKSFCKIEGK
jgi:hypothetical protein